MSFLLLKTKLRKDLLSYLFSNPDKNCYLRELASLIDADAGNLSRELRMLEGEGLLISKKQGNQKMFRINKKYPLFKELKQIIFKTTGIEGSLRKLLSSYRGIKKAFIYGSYSKNIENSASDVDLMIVGDVPVRDLTSGIRSLEDKLSREINFTVFSEKEYDKEKQKNGSFVHIVESGKKISLKEPEGEKAS
jgi:predicted nucleotidyltransferase